MLLPGDDLPTEIRKALAASEFLLYLASKEAAESEKELRIWCDDLKRGDRLIVVHMSDRISVDLEANQIALAETDALPAILEGHLSSIQVWADMTWAVKDEHLDLSNLRYKTQINAIIVLSSS